MLLANADLTKWIVIESYRIPEIEPLLPISFNPLDSSYGSDQVVVTISVSYDHIMISASSDGIIDTYYKENSENVDSVNDI
jgi:hypothetical protein